MKPLLVLFGMTTFSIFYPMGSIAQVPTDPNTGKYSYTNVIVLDNMSSKAELYARAKLWLIATLIAEQSDLPYQDEESGTLIGNGNFNVNYERVGAIRVDRLTTNISFTMKISTKDGKYRYEISNFYYLIIAWNLTDGDGNILPINNTKTPLESGLAVKSALISTISPSNLNAANRWYYEIDNTIREKIASLAKAMQPKVGDDNW